MLEILDFKPFIPSHDYAVSKAFYEFMGFTVNWDDDEVCEIDTHYNYTHSLMLHFTVNSAQEWYDHFEKIGLVEKFKGTKIAPPKMMPWGLLITYVWDPAGVLLHFAERPEQEPA